MPKRHNLVVDAAMVIADGAWLFMVLAVLGFFANQLGSPLPWFAVFGLLAFGLIVTRILVGRALPDHAPAIIQSALGMIAVYLAMAASTAIGRSDFDLSWGMRFVQGDYPAVTVLGSVIGLFGGAYVWRHAVLWASAEAPEHRLLRSFRVGIVAFAVALLVEQASGQALGAIGMLVPFFAASLAGLAIARLRQHGGSAGAWTRVVAMSVVVIVGLGLALGAFGGLFARDGVMLIARGWGYLIDGLSWLVRLFLEPLLAAIFALLAWLQESMEPPQPGRENATPARPNFDWLETEGGEPLADSIVAVLQYPAMLAMLALICWILVKAYQRQAAHRQPDVTEHRESIAGDGRADLARMLWALLPQWMKRAHPNATAWRYPQQETGITEVFRLYFDTLSLALERGLEFDPGQTPTERIPLLRNSLPGAPIDRITALFNAACYGRERSNSLEIDALMRQLDQLSTEPDSDLH